MKILVSACLLGENCKYNGGNNRSEKLISYLKGHDVIAVCPEVMGGLAIPRIPCEIVDGIVRTRDGKSCDREFKKGARLALDIAEREKVDVAILQSRSPSCGVYQIYDGSFSGVKKDGSGVFASILKENGFKVMEVKDLA